MAATVRDILLRFTGDAGPANREVDELAAHLDAFDGTDAEAAVTLARKQFDAAIIAANAELDRLGARDVTAAVRLKIEEDRGNLERIARDASVAFERYFQPKINPWSGKQTGILGDVGRLLTELAPSIGDLRKLDSEIEQTGQALDKSTGFFAKFGDKVSQIQPIAGGVAILLAVGLVPAIVAVGASALTAVAGVGALAAAFVGALLPALIPVVAAVMSISGVIKALQARAQAQKQADADAVGGAQKAQQQAIQQHALEVALRDAIEAKTAAERHYAQAVEEARDRIRNARRDEKRAEQDLADTRKDARRRDNDADRRVIAAQKRVKQAVVEAHKAWQAAIQRTKDATLDLEGAQLDLLDANDRLWRAQNAFNSLLNQIPSDKLGDVLKKLSDVNVPEDQAVTFIAQNGGMSESDAHKLYRAYLDLKEAQHGVKVSTNDLTKAQKEKKDADADEQRYIDKGIKAYGPYLTAVKDLATAKRDEKRAHADSARAIRDAQQRLADARRTLNGYVRDGVKGSPQVVDAMDAVRDATQRVRDAQWQLRHRAELTGDTMAASARRALGEWKKLTPAQKELADGILAVKKALKGSGLGDIIVGALGGAAKAMAGFIRAGGSGFAKVAGAMADAISTIVKAASGDKARLFFFAMGQVAQTLTRVGAHIFVEMARAFAGIALAASPALIDFFKWFDRTMKRFADFTNSDAGASAIGRVLDTTRTWGKALGHVLGMFSRLIGLATPFGDELVKSIGKWADGLFRGGKGADGVKRFFKDTIPFAKSLGKFVVAVATALIQVFEFVAPILKPFVDMGTSIAETIAAVVGWLNKIIPAPIREVAGFITTMVVGAPKLVGYVGRLPGIIGKIAKVVAGLGIVKFIVNSLATGITDAAKAAADVGKAIVNGIIDAVTAAWNLNSKIRGWLLDAVGNAAGWVAGIGTAIVNGIGDGLGDAAAFGKKILGWIAGGIGTAVLTGVDVGSSIANWLVGSLAGIASWGTGILKAIRKSIEDAASATGKAAVSAGGVLATWLLNGIKDAGSFGGKVLSWIRGAISDAVSAGGHGLASIGKWLLDGIKSVGGFGGRILSWIRGQVTDAFKGAAGFGGRVASLIFKGLTAAFNAGKRVVSWIRSGLGELKDLGASIAEKLWDGMKSLPGRILRGVKGAINAIIRGWNNLSFRIGGTDLGPLGHLPSITINTPDIPTLAAGGIASAARLAVVGDTPGADEAIMPLTSDVFARLGRGIVAALSASSTFAAPSSALASSRAPAAFPMLEGLTAPAGDTFVVATHAKEGAPDPGETVAAITHRQRGKSAQRGTLRPAA